MANRPCSCIRDRFSIFPSYVDKSKLVLHDLSNWVEEEGFTYPDFFDLTIIFPNEYKLEENVAPLNGIVLENDFIDGIYIFQVNICGEKYEQSHLLTPKIDCCLNKARITVSDKKQNDIDEIYTHLSVARENALMGNNTIVEDLIKLIKNKINALSCNCNC